MSTHRQAISWLDWAKEPETFHENGWTLARKYGGNADAPVGLIDLSHRPKAAVYGPSAEQMDRLKPGRAAWNGRAFTCCRKPGERILFDLAGPLQPQWPNRDYTDLTDAWVFLALIGPRSLEVMQRMAAIDLEQPDRPEPLFAVTRSHGMWIQVLNPKWKKAGFFLACDRSQGRHLAAGLHHAGRGPGLKVAALDAFSDWLGQSV